MEKENKEQVGEQVEAYGDDGKTYQIPAEKFKIINADVFARSIALVSILANVVIGGLLAVERMKPEEEEVIQEVVRESVSQEDVDEIWLSLQENIMGDCVNENTIRDHLQLPPVTLIDCIAERKGWLDGVMGE